MIGEFLGRNYNTDALIILIIGLIIPIALKFIYHIIKKLMHRIIHYAIGRYKNYKRLAQGRYNINELIQIEEKPENERSEKEKRALNEHYANMKKTRKEINNYVSKIQDFNKKITDMVNK